MLSQLRDATKTWIAGLFIGLLVLAFAIWGIEDIFRSQVRTAVATVGSTEVEARSFQEEFDRIRSQFAGGAAPLPMEQALQFGLDRIALDRVINTAVLDAKAKELGLTLSDQDLAQAVQDFEAFQGPTGRFDRVVYRNILAQNSLSPAGFEAILRRDLTRAQLLTAIGGGVAAPRSFAASQYDLEGEKRQISYVVLPPEAGGVVGEPSEEELEALHQRQSFQFTAPEYRTFTYLAITPQDLADEIALDEDRLREEYEFRKDSFLDPERRTVRQIVFPEAEDAEAARQRIAEGTAFETIAAERELTSTDTDLGEITQDDMLDAAAAEAVFALAEPGLTDVIEGDFGFILAEVTAITPGSEQSFEEVRESLRKDLAIEEAEIELTDVIERIEDARAAGQSLEEAASAMALTARTIGPVDRRGVTPDDTAAEDMPQDQALLQQAFTSEPGQENSFEAMTEGGYAVVRVDDITPSALKPLERVREEVEALWRTEEITARLEAEATKYAAQARHGETLERIAETLETRVITPVDPLGRDSKDAVVTPDLIESLFALPQGGVVSGPAAGGAETAGYVIVKVIDVVPAPTETADRATAVLLEGVTRSISDDLAQQLITALRTEFNVTINEGAVARALGQDLDSGGF